VNRMRFQAEEYPVVRGGDSGLIRVVCAILLIIACISYGGIGKDLFYNTVRAGDADDPYGTYWNFSRYALIVCTAAIVCMGGAESIFRVVKANKYMLPYGLLTVASLMWTADSTSTFRGVIILNGLLLSVAALVGNVGASKTMQIILHVFAAVVISSAAAAILMPAIGRHDTSDILFTGLAGKWRGIFAHKNTLGGYASFAVVTLWLFGDMMRAPRLYLFVARVCAFLCIAMAASANAISGVIFMTGTYFLLVRREFMNWLVAVWAVIVGLLTVALASSSLVAELLGRDETFSGRTFIWEVALQIWQESPLLGYGFRGASAVTGTVLTGALFESAVDVHNAYLETLLDTGIVGLALLLFGLAASIVKGFVVLKRERGPERRVILAMTMLVVGGLIMAFGEVAPLRVISHGSVTYIAAVTIMRLGRRSSRELIV
jgi:exopolysaccharide production protein ExoQ